MTRSCVRAWLDYSVLTIILELVTCLSLAITMMVAATGSIRLACPKNLCKSVDK